MDKGKAPPSEIDITEDRLEEDFFFFVSYAKMCMKKLSPSERPLGEKWVMSLITRRAGSMKEKMLRNMHLADLLGEMMQCNLTGIYASEPPSRDQPLPPIREDLIPCIPPEIPPWVREAMGKGEEAKIIESQQDTIRHRSVDGKTYVASKELPNGRGAMGFVALSMDEQIINEGDAEERKETCTLKEKTWQTEETGRWHNNSNVRRKISPVGK